MTLKGIFCQSETLHEAFAKGMLKSEIEAMVKHGANANEKTPDGTPILTEAIWRTSFTTARLLIRQGADVNSKDPNGDTPLHAATDAEGFYDGADDDCLEVIGLLLDRGADINAANKNGDTPLHSAIGALGDRMELIQLQIEEGAPIEKISKTDRCMDVIRLLIDRGADLEAANTKGETPLLQAENHDCAEAVQLIKDAFKAREDAVATAAAAALARKRADIAGKQQRMKSHAVHIRIGKGP
jgi:ankyrin repeat protein